MNFTLNQKTIQTIIAYASIVFGVLTQALSGIHLPPTASIILGVFGVLLHPTTSITSPPASSGVAKPATKADGAPPGA